MTAFVLVMLTTLPLPLTVIVCVTATTGLLSAINDAVLARATKQGWALTAAHVRIAAITGAGAMVLPGYVFLAAYDGGLVQGFAAGSAMVAACLVLSYRSILKGERRRLTQGPVEPRGVAHASRVVEMCRDGLRRFDRPVSRPWLEFNLAQALAIGSITGHPREWLDEAATLLGSLAEHVSPDSEIGRRVSATHSSVAMALSRVDGDRHAFEATVEVEWRAALNGAPDPNIRAEALLSRALLLTDRMARELNDAAAGRLDVKVPLATMAEARTVIDEALALVPDMWQLNAHRAQILAIGAAFEQDSASAFTAFEDLKRALAGSPPDHPEMRTIMMLRLVNVLGLCQVSNFEADLREEVDHVEGLLRSVLDDAHRDGFGVDVLEGLTRLELIRYDMDPTPPGAFEQVVAAYRRAAEHSRLSSADDAGLILELAGAAADYDGLRDMAETAAGLYAEALQTLHRIASTGLARRHRTDSLRNSQTVASELAHWLIELRRHRDAVTALETGRAFMLTESLRRERLELRLRENGHHRLADTYARLTSTLAKLELDVPSDLHPAGSYQRTWWLTLDGRRHRQTLQDIRRRWEACIDQIRCLPGFADLQAAPRYDDLIRAAAAGALVYVTATERRGYALIVTADLQSPRVVRLPGLTAAELNLWASRYREGLDALARDDATVWRDRLDQVFEWLGETIMDRIAPAIKSFAEVTLIPLGALAVMPLHAAGSENTRHRLSGLTLSYAPNARTLISAMETVTKAEREPPRMLVVTHSGEPPKMLTRTRSQIQSVQRHFPTATVLPEKDATRASTLQQMRAHGLYHFACHGRADPQDPLRSRLLLHDGPLTLRDLIKERFPAARLAVLSACETSVPNPDLPDEVISLPSALVEAGVPGTIGALWQVREFPTALLMARFYELWKVEGKPPRAALGEAQRWLRDSTRSELIDYSKDFLTWPRDTPKLRERRAGERPYSHPDDWAAFIYTGL